jgi:hypothetical protein
MMFQILVPIIMAHLLCFQTDIIDAQGLAKFQKELSRRVKRDQGVRIALIKHRKRLRKKKTPQKPMSEDKELKRLEKRASDVDDENLAWLKKLIENHGFPKSSEIGEKSADEFYLLVVHADRDREFQKECLEHMKEMPTQWPKGYISALERRSSFPSSRLWNKRIESKKAKPKKIESKVTVEPNDRQLVQEPIPEKKQ